MKDVYEIIAINGHYEVYAEGGEFMFSGDTYSECESDLMDMLERKGL